MHLSARALRAAFPLLATLAACTPSKPVTPRSVRLGLHEVGAPRPKAQPPSGFLLPFVPSFPGPDGTAELRAPIVGVEEGCTFAWEGTSHSEGSRAWADFGQAIAVSATCGGRRLGRIEGAAEGASPAALRVEAARARAASGSVCVQVELDFGLRCDDGRFPRQSGGGYFACDEPGTINVFSGSGALRRTALPEPVRTGSTTVDARGGLLAGGERLVRATGPPMPLRPPTDRVPALDGRAFALPFVDRIEWHAGGRSYRQVLLARPSPRPSALAVADGETGGLLIWDEGPGGSVFLARPDGRSGVIGAGGGGVAAGGSRVAWREGDAVLFIDVDARRAGRAVLGEPVEPELAVLPGGVAVIVKDGPGSALRVLEWDGESFTAMTTDGLLFLAGSSANDGGAEVSVRERRSDGERLHTLSRCLG